MEMLIGLISAGLLQTTPEVSEFTGAIVLTGPEDTIKQLSSLISGSHSLFFSPLKMLLSLLRRGLL